MVCCTQMNVGALQRGTEQPFYRVLVLREPPDTPSLRLWFANETSTYGAHTHHTRLLTSLVSYIPSWAATGSEEGAGVLMNRHSHLATCSTHDLLQR